MSLFNFYTLYFTGPAVGRYELGPYIVNERLRASYMFRKRTKQHLTIHEYTA